MSAAPRAASVAPKHGQLLPKAFYAPGLFNATSMHRTSNVKIPPLCHKTASLGCRERSAPSRTERAGFVASGVCQKAKHGIESMGDHICMSVSHANRERYTHSLSAMLVSAPATAMPTSAFFSAGASLTPSPVMATCVRKAQNSSRSWLSEQLCVACSVLTCQTCTAQCTTPDHRRKAFHYCKIPDGALRCCAQATQLALCLQAKLRHDIAKREKPRPEYLPLLVRKV